MHLVLRGSAAYPERLEDLPDPPAHLYLIGDPCLFDRPLVSIVGTRDATPYGLRMTRSIAGAFARAGITVVSGMARGIDAAAHRAALDEGGTTIAVLGTGIDVPYPVAHRELHRLIGLKGLLVSESGPGAPAHKGAFPKRNRIIAALSPVTIVVEAGHVSGALNTARHVMQLGRTLAAVPGPVDSRASEGTNHLLRDGATVIAAVEDALALAGITEPPQARPVDLAGNDGAVWSSLAAGPMTIDALAVSASISTRECIAAVIALELKGMAESLVTGEVRRR